MHNVQYYRDHVNAKRVEGDKSDKSELLAGYHELAGRAEQGGANSKEKLKEDTDGKAATYSLCRAPAHNEWHRVFI